MSGYGAGYGDTGMTGYEDPNAVTGYGTATGEARFVCKQFILHFGCAIYPHTYIEELVVGCCNTF